MASKSYLLDITANKTNIPKIKDALKKFNDALVLQVVGENRIAAVVNDAEVIREKIGDDCQMKCTPLRPYSNFASTVLGLNPSITNKKYDEDLRGGSIYWLHFKVDYPGKALDELKRIWLEEAKFVYAAKDGGLKCRLFKTIASREVHAFILSAPDAIDDTSFQLPLMNSLGDQVIITTKEVRL